MSSSSQLSRDTESPLLALQLQHRGSGQWQLSAALFQRVAASIDPTVELAGDKSIFVLRLFEFMDNQQFSALDSFLTQIGGENCQLLVAEDFGADLAKASSLSKKISLLLECKGMQPTFVKKNMFAAKPDTMTLLQRLCGQHVMSKVETDFPRCLPCVECVFSTSRYRDMEGNTEVQVELGSMERFMRLDSAAADAVNLLPKADHPSVFGSLFGVLNRCKTKLGSRTLERWLRQPLLDITEINQRLNVVQLFTEQSVLRDQLRDGPLKAIPDLEAVANKMRKKTAGLGEMFRLYLFTRSLPDIVSVLEQLSQPSAGADEDGSNEDMHKTVLEKFLNPLRQMSGKFSMYEKLIEHVVDFSQLPDFRVNAQHDEELQELAVEQKGLEQRAEKIWNDARMSYASFAEVKLEKNNQHGFILRTTRGEDERQLREKNAQVKILSILKNGTHFTTPALERIAERFQAIDQEYEEKQEAIVSKALETAMTYLPLVESVATLISELDVLQAFATAASFAPGQYVRPQLLAKGSGVIKIENARHPCVEMMDNMQFIANDYDLQRNQSSFHIITGPNMGGKSTYIRCVGCIVVLAQMGMFVPCDAAEISLVDCILARVGAGDAVQKGVSTFMAEMLESAVILNTATKDSLIIIDELGRGTSTYDGFGIAWAISDYIVSQINCLCLFATHFHELTALVQQHPREVVNKHVSAHVDKGQLVMLYRLQEGPCTKSFGIHVAKMANFPPEVITEAKRKAAVLERHAHDETDEAVIQQVLHKRQRIEDSLRKFKEANIPSIQSGEKVRSVLQELFPKSAISELLA